MMIMVAMILMMISEMGAFTHTEGSRLKPDWFSDVGWFVTAGNEPYLESVYLTVGRLSSRKGAVNNVNDPCIMSVNRYADLALETFAFNPLYLRIIQLVALSLSETLVRGSVNPWIWGKMGVGGNKWKGSKFRMRYNSFQSPACFWKVRGNYRLRRKLESSSESNRNGAPWILVIYFNSE